MNLKEKPLIGWGIFIVAMVAVFLLGLLAASITERRAEIATIYNNKKIEITGINPLIIEAGVKLLRTDVGDRYVLEALGGRQVKKLDLLRSMPNS